jgi:hypothetical protein
LGYGLISLQYRETIAPCFTTVIPTEQALLRLKLAVSKSIATKSILRSIQEEFLKIVK